MDILRLNTAGSVDDGKSTLIGRLLFDTQSIPQDKLEAIAASSQRKGLDFVDLSLLTDGLIAEREQGITIDVAHVYFSTPTRKYIIADSPGHVEYTRNMVTGASTAQVSIILIDSRHGVVEQTYRHFFISTLLRIPKVLVCVNKMDLVNFSQDVFSNIVSDFYAFAEKIKFEGQIIDFIPVCSLHGDNIAKGSDRMPWYEGKTLLQELETTNLKENNDELPARMPVQYVVRPRTDEFHDYRGYAGKISSGIFKVGDTVTALPSEQTSVIKKIQKFESSLDEAHSKESVTLLLTDDIDISRGNMLVKKGQEPIAAKYIVAHVCWMAHEPLSIGKVYWLQHGNQLVKAKIDAIQHVIVPDTLEHQSATQLKLNDIAVLSLKLAHPIFADTFATNRSNGGFICVDPGTNNTVGVGFIEELYESVPVQEFAI
ncbi:GTP-binding protein [Cytophagaceae bacterium YF14B1]|uniref:sulfate adenylyltransferase n=1 Tax=Xanthocytophaga flava TaxID=3048013 RepID=A0AAE3QRE0_9BACT|nr:GTP-binding protein [Xanthocytophaga flavus]MDJ1473453.1 GTP-binding protein [Xanthocytophaga flavus]MDJ1482120.1 GTP-binding protein [Xanthocytophaga flavus]